jgi:hypothetical protein
LRNLEAQLRTAYVSKELAAQLAEKESARLEEKVREKPTVKAHLMFLDLVFDFCSPICILFIGHF